MKKIFKTVRLLLIQLGCNFILSFSLPAVFAQGLSLPNIPGDWPTYIRNKFSSDSELVKKKFTEYNEKLVKYNARCGDGMVPLNNKQLVSDCAKWSGALDKEAEVLLKIKANYLARFNDYDVIWKAHVQTKKNEQLLSDKIYPNGKPLGAFGENVVKNPDLNDTNVDLSAEWGGSRGTSPNMPDLNYGNKNSAPIHVYEQKLAKKYPAFNEILVNENKLKAEDTRIKNEGTTLYQQIKEKGTAATKDDWDKLKKITDDLNANKENLKKIAEQKEKAKNNYSVSDPF